MSKLGIKTDKGFIPVYEDDNGVLKYDGNIIPQKKLVFSGEVKTTNKTTGDIILNEEIEANTTYEMWWTHSHISGDIHKCTFYVNGYKHIDSLSVSSTGLGTSLVPDMTTLDRGQGLCFGIEGFYENGTLNSNTSITITVYKIYKIIE